jgi:hypothetical protein
MGLIELKDKLIERIRQADDEDLLKEISYLPEMQEPDRLYPLNEEQKTIVKEAREQIQNQQSLSNEEANKDIDEWLNK